MKHQFHMKAYRHGRVGVRRLHPTSNQALRQRVGELERELRLQEGITVPTQDHMTAVTALSQIEEVTHKSRTGAAHKANAIAAEFLADGTVT